MGALNRDGDLSKGGWGLIKFSNDGGIGSP